MRGMRGCDADAARCKAEEGCAVAGARRQVPFPPPLASPGGRRSHALALPRRRTNDVVHLLSGRAE